MGPVPERPISANPGLKFCSTFCIYLPMHCLIKQHFVLSFLFVEVKAQQYFVSSRNMFFDKKTLLKIGLILGGHLSRNRARLHAGQRSYLFVFFCCGLFVLFCFLILSIRCACQPHQMGFL